MNTDQNTVLLIGGILILLNTLFAPIQSDGPAPAGRTWIMAGKGSAKVDIGRLIVSECIIAGIVITVLGFVGIDNKNSTKKSD